MAININEADLKDLVGFIGTYKDDMRKNFTGAGVDVIKDCGIAGDKKAEIDKTADSFEEGINAVLNDYEIVTENIKTFVADVLGFNAEDYFGSAQKEFESAKSAKKADVRSKMFKGK